MLYTTNTLTTEPSPKTTLLNPDGYSLIMENSAADTSRVLSLNTQKFMNSVLYTCLNPL